MTEVISKSALSGSHGVESFEHLSEWTCAFCRTKNKVVVEL